MIGYARASAALRRHPEKGRDLQFYGTDLGARLAGAGIPLERLECWVMPIKPEDISQLEEAPGDQGHDRARSVAKAAEWLLQRVFHPVLGRR